MNIYGEQDGTYNYLLTGMAFSHVGGSTWSVTSGAAVLNKVLVNVSADATFDAGVATGYVFLNTGGTLEGSANHDVAGCLLGEVNGSSYTDYRNGRRLSGTKWTQINSEHQNFRGEIDFNNVITTNGTAILKSSTYVTGAINQLGNYNLTGNIYQLGNGYNVGDQQITGTLAVKGSIQLESTNKIQWIDSNQFIYSTADKLTVDGDDYLDFVSDISGLIDTPLLNINSTDINLVGTTPDLDINAGTLSNVQSLDFVSGSTSSVNLTDGLNAANEYQGITIDLVGSASPGQGSNHAGDTASDNGDCIGVCVASDKILILGIMYKTVAGSDGDIIYVNGSGALTTSISGLTKVTPIGTRLSSTKIMICPSFVVIE